MLPIDVPEADVPEGFERVGWAKDQAQFHTLPAVRDDERTLSVWSFTDEEREAIGRGANLFVTHLHYGRPLLAHSLRVQGLPREEPPDEGAS